MPPYTWQRGIQTSPFQGQVSILNTREQADLHQPDTVAAAVNTSGATGAFIYVAHGSMDNKNATLSAEGLQSHLRCLPWQLYSH